MAVRCALEPLFEGHASLLLFTLATIVAARYGGSIPGLASTGASALIDWYFFIPPRVSFETASPAHALELVLFAIVGTAISLLSGQFRGSAFQSALQGDTLRTTARERERYLKELEVVRDSIAAGLIVTDLEGTVNYVNQVALTGLGCEDVSEAPVLLRDFHETYELSTEEGVLPIERWPLTRILRGEQVHDYLQVGRFQAIRRRRRTPAVVLARPERTAARAVSFRRPAVRTAGESSATARAEASSMEWNPERARVEADARRTEH